MSFNAHLKTALSFNNFYISDPWIPFTFVCLFDKRTIYHRNFPIRFIFRATLRARSVDKSFLNQNQHLILLVEQLKLKRD